MTIYDIIYDIYRNNTENYIGEPITQLQHAEQAAYFADTPDNPYLVIAALLHDIGHLLHNNERMYDTDGSDLGVKNHEQVGADYLASLGFPKKVTEPIRLHPLAKRYLVSTDPAYLYNLSPASRATFEIQGGIMTPEEIKNFERSKWFHDALALRDADDKSKLENFQVPPFETYRELINAAPVTQIPIHLSHQ